MAKVKILGLSFSPRKGANTDYMVKTALLAASQVKDVETEFINATPYVKHPCIACAKCDIEPDLQLLCRGWKDDKLNEIMRKEYEASGFIIGVPVYWAGPTAQFKMWIDRHESQEFGLLPNRNKPFGVLTIGSCRSGGQAQTIEDVQRTLLMADMIPIGAAAVNTAWCAAGIHGAAAIQCGWPELTEEGPNEFYVGKDAVKYDKLALLNCLVIGERVAEMAKVIEAGFTLCNPENGETRWPVHTLSEEQSCLDLLAEYEEKGLMPRIDRKAPLIGAYTPLLEERDAQLRESEWRSQKKQ